MSKGIVPANHKVSVAWQIVFTFIPILNIWAFYRIRKLRMYLLLIVLPTALLSAVLALYYLERSPSELGFMRRNPFALYDTPSFVASSILANVASFALKGFEIYLIIVWSRKHNRLFDQIQGQSSQ